jgi:coatomer protein complex subunit alpha (xenin)
MQAKADNLFGGPIGKVLLQVEDDLVLYDISARKVMAELQASDVKQVYWSSNFSNLAIVTKTGIIMSNKNLEVVNTVKETQRVKSGCFDESNAFIYSTSTHLKYLFCEGKTAGMFRSIDEPVYIAFFMRNTIYYFNRVGEMTKCEINNTDYIFK